MARKKQPWARPTLPPTSPFFCDTTIVYYRLHSHALVVQAIRDAVGARSTVLSNFVRGEYVRGYIYGMILLYSAIKAEESVQDGIRHFLAESMNRHRRVQNALESTATWMIGHENSGDVDITLDRLGDTIRNCLVRLDEEFPKRQRDPLKCEHGVLNFPPRALREDDIIDLYQQIEAIKDNPGCSQCTFKEAQIAELTSAGTDLYSESQQTKYAACAGYVKQTKHIATAVRSNLPGPSCRYCELLGDTIIALQAPRSQTILTGDKQSFPALAEILDKPLKIVPSYKELRKGQESEGT